MKFLLVALLAINLFGQGYGNMPYGYNSGNYGILSMSRYSGINLNGVDQFMSKTYTAADSFLNMNGYERTVLPQSTMKINFNYNYNGYDSLNTFTSAVDTTAGSLRRWYTGAVGNQGTSIVNGKLRVSVNGNAQGVQFGKVWAAGTLLYVKLKAKLVSLTSGIGIFRLNFTSTTIEEEFFTPITAEERTYEFTILAGVNNLQIITYGASTAVIELDDIEVREITNSVVNGTFISGTYPTVTNWTLGTGWYWDNSLYKIRAISSSTRLDYNIGLAMPRRKYIVTYQIDSLIGSIQVGLGNSLGQIKTTNGEHCDTIIAATGSSAFYFNVVSGPASFTLDNVHVYEIPSYTYTYAGSNHTVGWSKIDALIGAEDSTSLKIVSTGAGDSITNHIKIFSSTNTFHGFTSGNKYTVELWARGTGIRGTNLVPDSACYFNTSTGGVTWWGAGNGSATWESTDSSLKLSSTSTGYIYRNGIVSSGATYRISFKVRATSYTGSIQVYGGTTTNAKTTNSISSSWQTFVLYVTSDGTTLYIQLLNSHTGDVYFDNIVVQALTAPTITLVTQGQTKTSSAISVTPGTFTKLVWNFTANSTLSVDTLKFYINQADTVWIDSVNISQAYDMLLEVWTYTNQATGYGVIFSTSSAYSMTYQGQILGIYNSQIFYYPKDGFSDSTYISTSDNLSQWMYFAVVHKRTSGKDSVFCYKNGVNTIVSALTLGKIRNGGIYLGNNSGYFYQGYIGEVRLTRFDNIDNSNYSSSYASNTYNNYTRGQGFTDNLSGGGKKIAVWYDWSNPSSNSTLLMDLSGNGYNLIGNNVTTNNWIQWKR